ncbi:MAG: hypothetical protein ACRD3Q_08700 [Terriglobales bacterium]
MRLIVRMIALLFVFTLIGCSSGEKSQTEKPAAETKQAPKQATLETGREAFQKMYVFARQWAPDAKPYRLESVFNDESNGQKGTASVWRSGFASPSRRGLKGFIWSGSVLPDAPSAGVTAGVEDTYNPSNSSTQIFDIAYLKVDSDKAYDVALKHGGEKLIKKNPKEPVTYLLDWNPRENILTWHVIFGPDPHDPKLRIAVNASTGDFKNIEH